jgi:hypothetical protein
MKMHHEGRLCHTERWLSRMVNKLTMPPQLVRLHGRKKRLDFLSAHRHGTLELQACG